MWPPRDRQSFLENAFSILRFRRKSVVSFRQFVVMTLWSGQNAIDLHDEGPDTQPMRVFHE